jgi:Protein of unknown function (DUF3761)
MNMQDAPLIRLSLLLLVGMSLIAATPSQAQDTATVTVSCTDGSSSKAGRGACSHHGGVNKGATTSGDTATSTSSPDTAGKAASTAAGPTSSRTAPASNNAMTSTSSAPADNTSSPATAAKAAPTAGAATAGAKSGAPTAKCKDGTMSYSKHHSGSCSHHGGVAEFLDK